MHRRDGLQCVCRVWPPRVLWRNKRIPRLTFSPACTQMTEEETRKLKDPIEAKYESEGHPYFASARYVFWRAVESRKMRDLCGTLFHNPSSIPSFI